MYLYFLDLQAQKRKLGLLEDDDIARLADTASAKEHEFTKRARGEYVSEISKSHGKLDCIDSTLIGYFFLSLDIFICSQITLKGLSTRS